MTVRQVQVGGSRHDGIRIEQLKQLFEHEREILSRIERTLNGGLLFSVNPFLLLADIGVELSDSVRAHLIARDPHLADVSVAAYRALREQREEQPITVRVKGLFEGDLPR